MQTTLVEWLGRLRRWRPFWGKVWPRHLSPSVEAYPPQSDLNEAGEESTPTVHSTAAGPPSEPPSRDTPEATPTGDDAHLQVRQLIKQALEAPTPEQFVEFLEFTRRFRRMGVWNTRMAYIQRPGAAVIATEGEWLSVKRHVLPDAVPIIILWPFSPIRYVYELADTGPPVDRSAIGDPFAATGVFDDKMLARLIRELDKQKAFRVKVEFRRQGFSYAGSAALQGSLPGVPSGSLDVGAGVDIGRFATANAIAAVPQVVDKTLIYRVTLNDRLDKRERLVTLAHELGHIFCGHLGSCQSHTAKSDDDDSEAGWADRSHLGKAEQEVEAEAVAFLIASRAGLVTASASYLSGYLKKVCLEDVDLDVIVRAAARIERIGKFSYGKMAFRHQG